MEKNELELLSTLCEVEMYADELNEKIVELKKSMTLTNEQDFGLFQLMIGLADLKKIAMNIKYSEK